MRRAVYQLITTDLIVSGLVPRENWFLRGTVPDSQPKPFGVLALNGRPVRRRGQQTVELEVKVFQDYGSYDLIESVLSRVELIMDEVVAFKWGGDVLAQARFNSRGSDLVDDGYQANVISSSFTLVGQTGN